jgi:hypothetical protein
MTNPTPPDTAAKVAYSLGMNSAGETAAQVANYLLADLRVRFRGDNGGQLLCDGIQESFISAIRESAMAAREHALTTLQQQRDAAQTQLAEVTGEREGLRAHIRAKNEDLAEAEAARDRSEARVGERDLDVQRLRNNMRCWATEFPCDHASCKDCECPHCRAWRETANPPPSDAPTA